MGETEKILRKLLWLHHGSCSFGDLYGDDGEMQCHACMIDFKRDPAKSIDSKLERIALLRLRLKDADNATK